MIQDLKGDEAWRMFRIISEFTEGFDKLSDIGFAVSVFGSARLRPGDPDYDKAVAVSRRLAEAGFSIVTGGGPGLMEAGNRGATEGGAISEDDLKFISVTDEVEEVVEILHGHREWKRSQIEAARADKPS